MNNNLTEVQQQQEEALRLLKDYHESGGTNLCPYSSLKGVKQWLKNEKKNEENEQIKMYSKIISETLNKHFNNCKH